MKMRELLSATALAGVLVSLPGVASAQTAPKATATPAASDKDDKVEETVVTGSRIGRAALDSPAPITSVSAENLFDRGQINVGDALNDLPQLRSTFSQANSTRFIGTSGLSILDLRGLGTARTLVLVNGRRHVTSVPGTYQVDTNT
ncbi:MAG: TonB-dependent receptor plug domain-containing protein, partial [Sphingomonas sp.]|nr:TonB-dependent receptor plug domain-containing protein [Sphingomonas sp.]